MSKTDTRPMALILTIVLSCVLLAAVRPSNSQAGDLAELLSQEPNYQTVTVARGVYRKTQNSKAREYYPVGESIRYTGPKANFLEFVVARGAKVEKGDCLARFSLDVSEADIESVQLTLSMARKDYEKGCIERLTVLRAAEAGREDAEDSALAALEVEQQQLAYDIYRLEQERSIALLQKELDTLLAQLTHAELRAPFSGVVDSLAYKTEGDPIGGGELLIAMHSTEKMLLAVEEYIPAFRYNAPVVVETGPSNHRTQLTGRVVASASVIRGNPANGYALIELDPYHDDTDFQTMMMVAEVELQRLDNVLLVPGEAVTWQDNQYAVTKLEDGVWKHRRFIPGPGSGREAYVWVFGGLEEDETLIVQ